MGWRHYLFGFRGRANRAKYWLWLALYLAALVVVTVVMNVFVIVMQAVDSPITGGAVVVMVQVLFIVLTILSSLAVMTRRLHDRNKSAWWLLAFALAPSVLIAAGEGIVIYHVVNGTISDNTGAMIVAGLCTLLALGVIVWAFVELGCLRGTTGANQYGPDPLAGKN